VNIRGVERVRRIARRIAGLSPPGPLILAYHRVAELSSDPQLLSVTPPHFMEHLDILRRYYRPAALEQAGQRLQKSVVVTFDDGYADNLWAAKPLLERYDVPATVFVTTGYIGRNQEFWWDELERLLLHERTLPGTLRLTIEGVMRQWDLGIERTDLDNSGWNVLQENDPSTRHSLYRSLHRGLRFMDDAERRKVLDQLSAAAREKSVPRSNYLPLSTSDVVRLGQNGLIEIGGHTVSHPILAALPRTAQLAEIEQSKNRLEEILGHPVTSFAYPYGGTSDYTEETVAAVRQAGYLRACANFPGRITSSSDRFQLPRFLVRDWDGDRFARQLVEWFNA
jgi:peptidoglycan/xylan/chitin deacetylase (PgdA/CDA1 family)